MKLFKLTSVIFILFIANIVIGQDVQLSPKEIDELKLLAAYSTRWNAFLNIWAILGPIFGMAIVWLGLRKKVEDWAEKEITKKANEKFGVDWVTVKLLVDDKKRDALIKAKRIAIINKETGRRQDLVTLLEKNGFNNPSPQFFSLVDYQTKFDFNKFDIVLLDNYDGLLTETDMRQIIEKHQFPYVLFTKTDLTPQFFTQFNSKVKFLKIQENLIDYIYKSF